MSKPYFFGNADVHVRHNGSCWEIRRSGQRLASSTHQTRWSAIRTGRVMAEEADSALHIHEHDGSVRIDERVQ